MIGASRVEALGSLHPPHPRGATRAVTHDDGGGTVWLTNDAPVVPGETIELELALWDAGDHHVDSLFLLDKFRWRTTTTSIALHE